MSLLFLIIMTTSCGNSPQKETEEPIKYEKKKTYSVESNHYDSLTIPVFFKKLVKNHIQDFIMIDSLEFREFCSLNKVNVEDSSNIEKYYTIKILHELFTSESAEDCSKGEILDVPYMWHWIEPNPRHEIRFVSDNSLLKDTAPPDEFSKYGSYADIDRTPYLYLSDLVSPEQKYYMVSCDTFSTFGWCSEREMAFVALLELLGYKGRIAAEGFHSWSEFLIPMKNDQEQEELFMVTVDNTFNNIHWYIADAGTINNWSNDNSSVRLERWYNRQAHSKNELNKINNHIVPQTASSRIEHKLTNYLQNSIIGNRGVNLPENNNQ